MLCTADNFYLTDQELADSPSRKDGIDVETETTLRIYGAQMIQEAGILLKCPQAVMATGMILLQRFYCKRSLKEYSVKKLAAAATYLATKLEECTRIRVRDLILVFDRLCRRREGTSLTVLEPGTREYQKAKDAIIRYERDILRVFGFIVHCDHPHKLLISFVQFLRGDGDLMQEAWNVVNDSLRTTLCLRFRSEVVASGAIFYAARKLQVPLPENVPWWHAFSVRTEQLIEVVRTMHELYQRPKAEYIHVLREPAPAAARMAVFTPDVTNNQDNSPMPDSSNINAIHNQLPTITQSGAPPAATGGDGKGPDATEATSTAHQEAATGATDGEVATGGAGDAEPSQRERDDRRNRDRDRRDYDRRRSRSRSRDRDRERDQYRRGDSRRDDRHRDSRDRDRDRDRDSRRDRDRGSGRDRDRSHGHDRHRHSGREHGHDRQQSRDGRRDDDRGGRREQDRSRLANASTADDVPAGSRGRGDGDAGREEDRREVQGDRREVEEQQAQRSSMPPTSEGAVRSERGARSGRGSELRASPADCDSRGQGQGQEAVQAGDEDDYAPEEAVEEVVVDEMQE